ncbi:CASP-like protein [Melia azedarach]|uniref:CASP-like protein n=1 Tax=Melia azedarach TaxID=155640 RepID=A0ACC1XQ15_MELAZ|nr:CASP-like protein [Melia azedarach]
MKEDVLVIGCSCKAMGSASPAVVASVSPVPEAAAATYLTQQPFPTPSPFSFSWLALAQQRKVAQQPSSSFTAYPEFLYCFIVNILACVYSFSQLSKGICDIAHRGILISDMTSDYISFILDQLVVYLLISSSSVAIPVIQDIQQTASSIWRAAIISTTMSFLTFLIFVTCTLISGYKLCKRIIW